MRPTKIIAMLTLVFWLIQSLVFVCLFASSFTDLIVRCFLTFGVAVPESSLNAFLSGAMTVLAWPVRVIFSAAWEQASFAMAILLLAVNSFIWGIFFGTIAHFLARNRRGFGVSQT